MIEKAEEMNNLQKEEGHKKRVKTFNELFASEFSWRLSDNFEKNYRNTDKEQQIYFSNSEKGGDQGGCLQGSDCIKNK